MVEENPKALLVTALVRLSDARVLLADEHSEYMLEAIEEDVESAWNALSKAMLLACDAE